MAIVDFKEKPKTAWSITSVTAILALVVLIWKVDDRYAKAEDYSTVQKSMSSAMTQQRSIITKLDEHETEQNVKEIQALEDRILIIGINERAQQATEGDKAMRDIYIGRLKDLRNNN